MNIRRRIKIFVWNNLIRDIKDNLAMQRIKPLAEGGPYIPWSQSALSATAISTVLNDIKVNNRSKIVECGGGVSTIFISSLLKELEQKEKHLYTIEHDESWISIMGNMIRDYGVSNWVTLIHAPLSPTPLSWGDECWYDTDILESELHNLSVDLLLIDGPPAHQKNREHARYPAVPFFKENLGVKFSVVLDDIDRESEYEIVEKWENILGIDFDSRILSGNISVATRGTNYHI